MRAIRKATPARSGILTGRFPHVNGVITDGAPMRAEEVTLDSVLKVAGYQNSMGWTLCRPTWHRRFS